MAKVNPTGTALQNKAREAKGAAAQGDQAGAPAPQDVKKRLVEGIGQAIRLGGLLGRAATSVGVPQATEKINAGVQAFTEAQKLIEQGAGQPTVPAQVAQGAGAAPAAPAAGGQMMAQGGM